MIISHIVSSEHRITRGATGQMTTNVESSGNESENDTETTTPTTTTATRSRKTNSLVPSSVDNRRVTGEPTTSKLGLFEFLIYLK